MNRQTTVAAVLLACRGGDGRLSPSVQHELVQRLDCWIWTDEQTLIRLPANTQEVPSHAPRGPEVETLFRIASNIECEYVAFVPASAAVDEDWITKVRASLERNGWPIAVTPVIYRFRGVRTANRFETRSIPLDWRPWTGPVITQGELPAVPRSTETVVVDLAGLVLRRNALSALEHVPLTAEAWPLILLLAHDRARAIAILEPNIRMAVDEGCARSIQPAEGARAYARAVTLALLKGRSIRSRWIRLALWLSIGRRASPGWLAGPLVAFDAKRRMRWRRSARGRLDGLTSWLWR